MHCAYKVKVYNGDGSVLITNIKLSVPVASADGLGSGGGNIVYSDGTGFFPILTSVLERHTSHTWVPDADVTYFGNSGVSVKAAAFGLAITDYSLIFGANDARFVFSNGSFIFFKRTAARTYTAYYCVEGTTDPTVTYKAKIDDVFSEWLYNSAYIVSLPMPLFKTDGTFSDWDLRQSYYNFGGTDENPYCAVQKQLSGEWSVNAQAMREWYTGIVPIDTDDPYQDIPDSEPSGPAEATGIPDSDPIDIPDLPTVSISDTGFITLFNPSLSQVKDLAAYMWTGLFDLATYKKIFADPMDCILGFNMLPVAIPHGTAVPVRVGNISTGINMYPATSQWVEVDCGTLDIGDAFGNYLSYSPYSKYSLYLPYIGIVELSADDVVGKTLALKYHIDVLSCSCVAYLKCGNSVLYQFTGSCGYSIPVSGNDFRATIANIVSITATVAGAVVTGGAAAGITAGTTAKAAAKAARMKAAQTAQHIGDAASVGKNVMGSKPEIHRSGAIGGSAGILGMQKPFLIVEYPNPCKPAKQYHYTGYPSFVTVKLSSLSGYAAFEEIIVEGVPCTETEQAMIKELCAEGIFL